MKRVRYSLLFILVGLYSQVSFTLSKYSNIYDPDNIRQTVRDFYRNAYFENSSPCGYEYILRSPVPGQSDRSTTYRVKTIACHEHDMDYEIRSDNEFIERKTLKRSDFKKIKTQNPFEKLLSEIAKEAEIFTVHLTDFDHMSEVEIGDRSFYALKVEFELRLGERVVQTSEVIFSPQIPPIVPLVEMTSDGPSQDEITPYKILDIRRIRVK